MCRKRRNDEDCPRNGAGELGKDARKLPARLNFNSVGVSAVVTTALAKVHVEHLAKPKDINY